MAPTDKVMKRMARNIRMLIRVDDHEVERRAAARQAARDAMADVVRVPTIRLQAAARGLRLVRAAVSPFRPANG